MTPIEMPRGGALLLVLVALPSLARGQVPLPRSVRSLEVIDDAVPVVAAPQRAAARRGTLTRGARVPLLRKVAGVGCGELGYYQLGEQAFVCASAMARSTLPPAAAPQPTAAMPGEYLVVRVGSARGYVRPEDIETDEYETALAKGFIVIARERAEYDGQVFVRTGGGHYLRERDLSPVHASDFSGAQLGDSKLSSVAFVVAEEVTVSDAEGAPLRRLPRLSRLQIAARQGDQLVLEDGGRVAAAGVVQPRLAQPQPSVGAAEPWLDIDLSRQLLVAYRGARPVFATLISSGKPRPKTRTPRGHFRIWVKLLNTDMRDRTRHELEQSYALEAVPWVQFFEQDYGLHAAFWHDRFGEPMSRGCINMSPADARFVFEFTEPRLAPGWEAMLPSEGERSTLVVVR